MAISKKAVTKKAAPAKKSKATKAAEAVQTGFDCFNRKISLQGKCVTLHDSGEVIIAKNDAAALAEFEKAVANTQFQ